METKRRTFSLSSSNNDTCQVHSPFLRGRKVTGPAAVSLRRRSPSPVVTGKVSSYRSKFESVPSDLPQTIPRTTQRLKSREPQEIFCHSLSSTPHLTNPGNIRVNKLSRDSSGIMSKSYNNPLSHVPSSSRLPNHFISLESEHNRPKINR